MLVFAEGGKPENPEKNPRSKARTSNKINTLVAPTGIEHGPHLWEASALITAPSLPPKQAATLTVFHYGDLTYNMMRVSLQ